MLATAAAANMYGDLVLYHRLATLDESKKRFWLRVLDRLILGFSDQQLVTGISILLIGFISICRISTYHFRVINSLGMFSCSSHLASVLSLRRYFQDHPTVAKIRITAMLFFAGLLSTSLILLGILPWTENIKCNAMCMVSRVSILDRICATLMTLYLIIAYWSALAYVFPNAEVRFVTWFNIRPALWIESALGPMGFGYQFQERLRHYRPLPPLTSSFFLQFIWWILSFVLGVSARARGNKSVKGTESIWTFGQILALLMIGLPFLTAVEVFLGLYISVLLTRFAKSMKRKKGSQNRRV